LLAWIIILTLISLEIIGYVIIYSKLGAWKQSIERETSTGSLMVGSKDYRKVIAILSAQERKKKMIIGLSLFLQIGPPLYFAPIFWPILDLTFKASDGHTYSFQEAAFVFFFLIFILCILCLLPFYYVIETQFRSPIVTTKGVANRSPWSRRFFLRWDDIELVSFTTLMGNEFILKSRKGNIRIICILMNLDKFAKALMENVPREKWVKVEKKLVQALKGPFY